MSLDGRLVRHIKVFDVDLSCFGTESDNRKAGRIVTNGQLTGRVVTCDDLMQDLEIREAVDVHLRKMISL